MEMPLKYAEAALDQTIRYAPTIVIALVIALVGWKLVRLVSATVRKGLERHNVDPSLRPFLCSLLDATLKIALAVTLIGYLGVPTTSFVAVIGAAGLAVGLALSGTLQNFAGGVILLVIRPFRVGDFIDAQGVLGKVHAIEIFQTTLLTPDNRTVFIPNGKLANESITNFSIQVTRRIDWVFGIGYGDDIDKARGVLEKLIEEDTRILSEPAAPMIGVEELGESSVDLLVRVWVASPDFLAVSYDMREKVKKAFDREGISIPFPQRDIHLMKDAG